MTFSLASLFNSRNRWRMETPDPLREFFRMWKALNERIGVRTDRRSEEDKTKWVLN